jgi:alkylation response protein AidB-like acyl-CoA dehydrogenase
MRLTAEQRELQELARAFAEGEIVPHAPAWDQAGDLPDEIFAKLGELGFMGMLVPEAYGGLELDVPSYLVVLEELARGDASVALAVAIHNGPVAGIVLAHGSSEQKDAFLPALAAGERLGAFALSEPAAGSDPGGLEARAEREADGWMLDGHKAWVTNGARAGLVLVFARTGAETIGCFAVEPPEEGYRIAGRTTTMGFRASETVDVVLDGLRLPASALVGLPDRGLAYALEALLVGRLGVAALALGVGEAALGHAVAYALEREQFGSPIARFDAIQAKLADGAARLAAARALTAETARHLDAVRREGADRGTGAGALAAGAAAAKLAATEAAMFTADEAVQIFGGYGYMRDYPVEKLMRDAKGAEIFEGTNEIMRVVIAREMLRAASTAR